MLRILFKLKSGDETEDERELELTGVLDEDVVVEFTVFVVVVKFIFIAYVGQTDNVINIIVIKNIFNLSNISNILLKNFTRLLI